MTSLTLAEPPASEPVTLAEIKAHARIDTDVDDALVSSLVIAARQWAEQYTRRAFITQTWRLWLDDIPAGNFVILPRAPLQSVDSVMVFDDSDAGTVWASGNYFADTAREPGRLALRLGAAWPVPGRAVNGLMIEYATGYGDEADAVPEPIRLAIKQLAAHWYEHRGEAVIMSSSRHDAVANQAGVNVPMVIQALLGPYRLQRLGN
ncbi:MAG: head-tail connector protein [Alphaproteobacteria bacterium]|nr:head-tail connector protein [Alphaproteobacteria bacterium]